jgi:tetratricopeptide (TPR) repeat protein
MWRVISCAAAVLLVFCVAGPPAAADDIATCREAAGDDATIAACSRLLTRRDAIPGAIYGKRGIAYHLKGEYDLAISDFAQAIRLDPKNAVHYNNRGFTYSRKSQYERAIADLDQAIRLDPKLANAYDNRGEAHNRRGEYDRAIADFDQAIRLDPKLASAYNNRGNVHNYRGEYDLALADFEQVLRLKPDLADARENRERAQLAVAARREPSKPVAAVPQPAPPRAAPQHRVALIIGNSAYRAVAALPNPRRDAEAVADALRQTGFQTVQLAVDLDRDGMVKALRAFRAQADKADWALVYFAGHGIEINGVNYLIPVDATLVDDRDVKTETVSYEELLSAADGARVLRLVVLDACRINPFKERMNRTTASRASLGRGLARPPETDPGTLIVYSAKEGEVANDDIDGVNSPFARAFVAQLRVPGREVRRLFDYVRDDVQRSTGRRQQPYTYGSLRGDQDFFFFSAE